MNSWDLIPVVLLVLFSLALSIGTAMVMMIIHRSRQHRALGDYRFPHFDYDKTLVTPHGTIFLSRPTRWLAIKSRNPLAVQCALGLHNPKPCSWVEGLSGGEKLFIAPPVRGWILVMGSGLPGPEDDVDIFYRFLMGLSRKLGQVQYFSGSPVLHHHAWIRAEAGRVVRAYAWSGATLWTQGQTTPAERELNLKCFDYGECADRKSFNEPDPVALNIEKVPLLAARWSLDPAGIEEHLLVSERGIAGEPSRRF